MIRKFIYICVAMLVLALSCHLGVSTSVAQGAGQRVSCEGHGAGVLYSTSNGDDFWRPTTDNGPNDGNCAAYSH